MHGPAARVDAGFDVGSAAVRVVPLPGPVDLARTLAPLALGRRDPTHRRDEVGLWRATRTPAGVVTLLVRSRPRSGDVLGVAWGPGAGWALEHLPDLVGATDDLDGFEPARHPVVAEAHRRNPGLRMVRSRAVLEAVLPTICCQKVTAVEAKRSHHGIVRRLGEGAPLVDGALAGRAPALRVQPRPERLAGLPSYDLHRLGLERRRADTLRRAAAAAERLERAVALTPGDAAAVLAAVPGLGPWSVAEVARVALGDPDAVSVGDYHLPNLVSWALAAEPRGDDARMLELLAPFAGHRGRVVRLLEVTHVHAPRYGPRMALRGFEDQ